jgi:hypothetical protein
METWAISQTVEGWKVGRLFGVAVPEGQGYVEDWKVEGFNQPTNLLTFNFLPPICKREAVNAC